MLAYYAGFVPSEGKISVTFPDVPGCITWGDTVEQAFGWAVEALALHLKGLAEDGLDIPEPSGAKIAWEKIRAEQEDPEPSGAKIAWEKIRAEQEDMGLGPLPEATQLLLVPAPDLGASPGEIRLSFQPQALDMIDRKAAAAGMTRSGFLARAAEAFQVEAH